ncbi:MAG: LysR family transcriptional regulator [Rubrivivax sp.]|nr:LysR family transcriptional regulator [Rubrivivax sp.]
MIVDLGALEVLEAILAQGSFTKAAASLNKTQAAVGYKIRKLEEQLGVEIFDRNGYRAELTPAGLMVLEEGRQLLHHAKRIRSIARNLNQDWEPFLELVIDGAVPMAPIMRALQALAGCNAHTRVRLKIEFLHGVQECFEDDDADLMIARDVDDQTHYRTIPLPAIDFVLCVAPEHPLAGRARVTSADLREFVKILVRDSRARIGTSDDVIAADGHRALYLSDFDTKKRAIVMGLGYGWLPTHLIADEQRLGRLRPVEFVNGNTYAFTPRLVTRLNRHRGRALELLERELQAQFERAGGAHADLSLEPAEP